MSPWWYGSVSQLARFVLMALAVAGLTMWWFSMAFGIRSRQIFPYLAFPVILGLILVGAQMVPLGQTLGGVLAPYQTTLYEQYATPADGELLVETDAATSVPVRITMDLDGTSRMFNLLILALICMMLGCHFFSSRRAIFYLPLVATLNGVAISCFGLFQKIRTDSEIFGMTLSQGGMAFGPFVNKNNAAGYLLICFACSLAVVSGAFRRKLVAGQRPRQIITTEYPIWQRLSLHVGLFLAELNATRIAALLCSLAIVVGIFATFSRGGILAFGLGIVAVSWYYCLTKKSASMLLALFVSGVLVAGVVFWTGFGERLANRFNVLSNVDFMENDVRMNHWVQTSGAIIDFLPLGSGVGSYLNVHRLYRQDNETALFYFAENQYFQTLVEAGIPGLLLLLSALALLILCVRFIALRGNSPKTGALCLLGVFLIVSQTAAALLDFGLFIPANVVLMAVICGFLAGQAHSLADRLKQKYIFRFDVPRGVTMVMLLALFAASLMSLMANYRYARIELAMGSLPVQENYRTLSLMETDKRIETLRTRLDSLQDADGLRRLGELYIYRYRIQLYELLKISAPLMDITSEQALDRTWARTSLDQLHGLIYQAWQSGNRSRVRNLIRDPDHLVRDNLLKAAFYLKMSRSRSPLQPDVHLLLGQLHSVAPTRNADVPHLERSMQLAPANALTAFVGGLLDLQAGRLESSCSKLRTCMEINGQFYRTGIPIIVAFLPPERIYRDVLPKHPIILYRFADTYLTLKSSEELKMEIFREVADLLDLSGRDDLEYLQAKATVLEELDDIPGAIDARRNLVRLNPDRLYLRVQLAELYMRANQLRKAEEVAQYLVSREADNVNYYNLLTRIRDLIIR
ncbi:MAG: O-antigen ligase family protein [Pirellulaceae bacterium]